MSSVKEPFIFASEDWQERLIEYARLLDPAAQVRGESSTVYSQHPHFGDVPARIRSAVPEASFVYLVRDPLVRAIAHYRQRVADGAEKRDINGALADFSSPDSAYLSASRYATQIRLYLEHFPAESFLVLDQDELRGDRAACLKRVFTFLGVEPDAEAVDFQAELNRAEDLTELTPLGKGLHSLGLLGLARRAPLPEALRRRAGGAVARPVAAGPIDPTLRAEIRHSLREEVKWLREFSGRAFPGWCV